MAVLYATLPVLPIHLSHIVSNLKTKKWWKIKIGTAVPHGTSKWSASFQLKRSKVNVTGHIKPPKSGVLFTYGRQHRRIKRGRRRLNTRLTPLLGLLYCQRLRPWAMVQMATYYVRADISYSTRASASSHYKPAHTQLFHGQLPVADADRMLGRRMLLMPPSLTLILRQRFDSVCGVVLFTFLAWTHCVARPNTISPTLFSSAAHTQTHM